MRFYVYCLLIVLLGPSAAYASDAAFDRQLASHVFRNSGVFPDELKKRSAELTIDLSIDRDGKLLELQIVKGTGSADEDADVSAALRRIQPYPHVPDNLEAPYKFSAIFRFVSPPRVGHVDLKWPDANAITAPKASFWSQVESHLRERALILSQEPGQHGHLQSAVAFTIDRDGTLLDAALTKRSGVKAVDEETIAWLKRIQPFPKIPPELNVPMKLTAEIAFGPKGIWNDEEAKRKVNGVCRGC
jgi:TonB family protein